MRPQPVELLEERLHQVGLLGDDDVLHVALHCCQRPVEGAADERAAIHHCELVMHVDRAPVAPHADPWGRRGWGWGLGCRTGRRKDGKFFNALENTTFVPFPSSAYCCEASHEYQ